MCAFASEQTLALWAVFQTRSPHFFFFKKTGLTTEGVLPPGPDHAFDSACIKTALAQEIYRRRT